MSKPIRGCRAADAGSSGSPKPVGWWLGYPASRSVVCFVCSGGAITTKANVNHRFKCWLSGCETCAAVSVPPPRQIHTFKYLLSMLASFGGCLSIHRADGSMLFPSCLGLPETCHAHLHIPTLYLHIVVESLPQTFRAGDLQRRLWFPKQAIYTPRPAPSRHENIYLVLSTPSCTRIHSFFVPVSLGGPPISTHVILQPMFYLASPHCCMNDSSQSLSSGSR